MISQKRGVYQGLYMCGYMHHSYAAALSEFGTPWYLPSSEGWILVLPITGTTANDGRGCYPLFACRNWTGLLMDLETLARDLVSLLVVADPFGGYDPSVLSKCFPDLFRPYKEHFVVDLTIPMDQYLSKHHLRNVQKAQKEIDVELCANPSEHAQQWVELYGALIRRHNIRGISAFSDVSLKKQLNVPGLKMFRAIHDGVTVGIMLFYVQEENGYYHLAAYNDMGYKLRASFALFAYVIDHFKSGLRWLNLGAGAGITSEDNDGLTRFKRGWSTGTRTAYICGRIFNRSLYDELCQRRGIEGVNYFPLYRKGQIW